MTVKNILYIDDDPVNRKLVKSILPVGQYNVLEASSGLEGLEKAKESRPDLILMDINMPGMDGYATTTLIKGTSGLSEIPVIALTALASEEDRKRGLIAGCDGYVTKPIDTRDFPLQIEKYLKGEKDISGDSDEITLLRDYSLHLVRTLERKVKKLEDANSELESRVEERTKELDAAQEELVEAEKKKALLEMAGAAAHELNQPLTVILSMSELILDDLDKSDENYSFMEKILSECQRAAEIVKKMGQVSRYRTKKYSENVDIIDIDSASSDSSK